MGCIQSRPGKRATSYQLSEGSSPWKRARSAAMLADASSADASSAHAGPTDASSAEQAGNAFNGKKDDWKGKNAAVPLAIKKTERSEKPTRPDPKDFIFSGLNGETRVKEPGTVNGQQFIIEDCEDCNLLIFDTSATITIDNCKGCCILLGPIDGSLFARNCTDCHIIVACRQFRTRECERCDVLLYCSTKPIIESSSAMRFGCFDYTYGGLDGQMSTAKMSPWVNQWSEMYDFTPTSGGGADHWTFLPEQSSAKAVLEDALKGKSTVDSPTLLSADNAPQVILKTWGNRPRQPELTGEEETECFALFSASDQERARHVASSAISKGLVLAWTNAAPLDAYQVKTLASSAPHLPPSLAKKLTGNTVGVCFRGKTCASVIGGLLSDSSEDVLVMKDSPFIMGYRRLGLAS